MTIVREKNEEGNHKGELFEDLVESESRIPPAAEPASNPFDPAELRLDQDYSAGLGVKKILKVGSRKPNRHEFIRVCRADGWPVETAVFEDKVSREVFLVVRKLRAELAGETGAVWLYLTVNRQRDFFLWPVKMPDANGRPNRWNESAREAAELAKRKWIRIGANMGAGEYDVWQCEGELSDPEWPRESIPEILETCFRTRIIKALDHPIIRQLRGLA